MQAKPETARDDIRRTDPPKVENVEDTELAYRVQSSTRGDPNLLSALIERYAGDLERWLSVYLFFVRKTDPASEEINRILQNVFGFAILHTDQFHGQASVFNWLFSIAYQTTKRLAGKDLFFQRIQEIYRGRHSANRHIETNWTALEEIPEKDRIPLILRYLFGLELTDLSNILNLPIEQVHRRLVRGRERFLASSSDPGMAALLQAYVDGLYADPDDLSKIDQHIESCIDCHSYLTHIHNFEKSISESLKNRWMQKQPDQKEHAQLAQLVSAGVQWTDSGWKVKVNIRQAAWIVSLLAVFAGMTMIFVRMTPSEQEFPQAKPTATPPLPPLINMEPVLANAQNQNNFNTAPQYIEQALSSDGQWAVFSYINTDLTTMRLALPTIYLYDRENNHIQVISDNSAALNIPWVWSELVPSISGDGQRIVYVSSTDRPDINGYPCYTQVHQPCLDIFLYDRANHSTQRITRAVYGGAADGDSLAPTISADGNWVAFWSAADNLVDVNKDICQSSETGINCLYIYLFSVQTGELQQIPIRNQAHDQASGVDRISLSADGRYVGFTLLSSALTSGISPVMLNQSGVLQFTIPDGSAKPSFPFIQQGSEVVVYDRQMGTYEFENVTPDGMAGNGPSSSAVLSSDGRYVAFVSSSSNLIGGDNNDAADVFVRDRQTGITELVSVSTHGRQGNNNSGLVASRRGFYSINISSDGRYVVFQSMADNLGQDVKNDCRPWGIGSCNSIYVHDRLTHETDSIVIGTNQSFSYFPGISTDGRWVSFSQYSFNCTHSQFVCSNVMLYDRQSNWMKNVTNFTQQVIDLPWMYFTNLSLPWQSWESRGLAFSPDGTFLAVGGFDSRIRIWHLVAGIRTINRASPDTIIETSGNVASTTMAFSPDSRWLAAGTNNGVVYIWQLTDGRLLYTLGDQLDPIEKIVFSQDGSHLYISTQYRLWIWSIGHRELVKEGVLSFGQTAIYAVDISPQGNLLATGHGDGTVWLQYLPSGKMIGRLGGQQLAVISLAFSHDGSLLAARSGEGKINLWNISMESKDSLAFALLNTIQSSDIISDLVFSPDNKYLASSGLIGTIGLWGVPDGKIYTLTPSKSYGMVYSVTFSNSDGTLATMFENDIEFWRLPPKYTSDFFTPATQDTFLNSQPLPLSTANDIPKLNDYNIGGMLSMDQATAKLEFPLIIPNRMPESFTYLGATINPDGSVWLRYIKYGGELSYQAILYIYESAIGYAAPPTMTIGASASVLPVRLDTFTGETTAEYVDGDWIYSRGFTAPEFSYSTSGDIVEVWRWDNSSFSQRLRWVEAGVFIALYFKVDESYTPILSTPSPGNQPEGWDALLSQEDLVQIASGMQWYVPESTGFACYVSGGRMLYRASGDLNLTAGRLCLKPELVIRHFKPKYSTL